MNKYRQHHQDINQLFNAPKHRRLTYIALLVIGVVIAAQLAMAIRVDDISEQTRLIIQGCSSLGAIVFVILVGVIAYRVFSEYFRSKYDRNDCGK
jgi:uncharacterized membrane protein YidH (DUF202 family)